MARIRAFQGVRYCADGSRLEPLLAPPYDVISPAQRIALAVDPHNIVHLELPLDEDGEGSRYDVAARRLRAWLDERVLASDEMPRLYAYRQHFHHAGRDYVRTGFFGLCELLPAGEASGMFPHEFTLSGPREDRLRLMRATRAHLSPIFLLYDDPSGLVRERLEHALVHAPLGAANTPWGTVEALGAVDGLPAGEIGEALSGTPFVFADGHHRYESALREHRERCGDADGWVLAVFVALQDPGLLVLPTHRIVQRAPEPARYDEVVARTFETTPLGEADEGAAGRAERWLAEQAAAGRCAFVERRQGRSGVRGLGLREGARAPLFERASAAAKALRSLDVAVLHALLAEGLGITPEAITSGGALSYSRSGAEAFAAVDGGAVAAFLMNATPVEQIVATARRGQRLPQKTTYFEPKMTSGWVLHVFDGGPPSR